MTSPRPKKITIPASPEELKLALFTLIHSRTLGKIVSELLLQALWIHRTGDRAAQVNFSRALRAFLDTWASSGREGGAHDE